MVQNAAPDRVLSEIDEMIGKLAQRKSAADSM
jgi:hypothetical protein